MGINEDCLFLRLDLRTILFSTCEHMLTSGVGLGDVPLGSCSHISMWFTRKNKMGINEDSLFLRVDLRTILFSSCSVFRSIFYCPKLVHIECL